MSEPTSFLDTTYFTAHAEYGYGPGWEVVLKLKEGISGNIVLDRTHPSAKALLKKSIEDDCEDKQLAKTKDFQKFFDNLATNRYFINPDNCTVVFPSRLENVTITMVGGLRHYSISRDYKGGYHPCIIMRNVTFNVVSGHGNDLGLGMGDNYGKRVLVRSNVVVNETYMNREGRDAMTAHHMAFPLKQEDWTLSEPVYLNLEEDDFHGIVMSKGF